MTQESLATVPKPQQRGLLKTLNAAPYKPVEG